MYTKVYIYIYKALERSLPFHVCAGIYASVSWTMSHTFTQRQQPHTRAITEEKKTTRIELMRKPLWRVWVCVYIIICVCMCVFVSKTAAFDLE